MKLPGCNYSMVEYLNFFSGPQRLITNYQVGGRSITVVAKKIVTEISFKSANTGKIKRFKSMAWEIKAAGTLIKGQQNIEPLTYEEHIDHEASISEEMHRIARRLGFIIACRTSGRQADGYAPSALHENINWKQRNLNALAWMRSDTVYWDWRQNRLKALLKVLKLDGLIGSVKAQGEAWLR